MLILEKNISIKFSKLLKVLQKNSVKMGVIACVLSVSLLNISITEGRKESSILFGQFIGLGGNSTEIVEKGISLPNVDYSASLVGLNMPKSSGMNTDNTELSEPDFVVSAALFDSTGILTSRSPLTTITAEEENKRAGIQTYVVQAGDSPSAIAAKYGISTNTLLWANNLTERSYIRSGEELVILPVTGVLHTIKAGETISGLASKYNADSSEIIAYNSIPADGSVKSGQKVIVPDGSMPVVRATVSRSYSYSSSGGSYSGSAVKGPNGETPHSFPWGQCTWYVSTQRYVPWGGHAKSWLVNARAYGYKTGATPAVGAIVVMRENSWLSILYGHVAIVEAVSDTTITISETNTVGLGKKSVRVLQRNYSAIKGYIY